MNPLTDIPSGDPLGVAVGVIVGFFVFAGLFLGLWKQYHSLYDRTEKFHKSVAEEREADIAELRAERDKDNERFRNTIAELQAQVTTLQAELSGLRSAQRDWQIERMDLERRHAAEAATWASERTRLEDRVKHLEQLLEERA